MSSAKSVAPSDRIGRLGVMYVRSILAQAGVAHSEVSGGEDHLAVDLTLTLPVGAVTVQVKAGTKNPNKDGMISVPTKLAWRDKWRATKSPVYLIYVRLEKELPFDWVEHADLHTTIHAHARWIKVNELSAPSAKMPASNRLTAQTFDEWVEDVNAAFGRAASE